MRIFLYVMFSPIFPVVFPLIFSLFNYKKFFTIHQCFSINLQKKAAKMVLMTVATIAGPTISAGFTLPYWLRYAIILTGISCRDDMFKIRNVHISLFATPLGTAFVFPRFFSFLLVSSNFPPGSPSPLVRQVLPPIPIRRHWRSYWWQYTHLPGAPMGSVEKRNAVLVSSFLLTLQ